MINPALEYISRKTSALKLEAPCSFMANATNGNKKVVVVHPMADYQTSLYVKVWDLNKASAESILPPSTATTIPKEWLQKPWFLFPEETKPIGYMAEFPSVGSNRRENPIPQEIYEIICGDMLFSQSHRENREQFIWSVFEKIFDCTSNSRWTNAVQSRKALASGSPKLAAYWNMWKIHMLNFENIIAPELYYWATSVSSTDKKMTV